MSDVLLHAMINEEAVVYACDVSQMVEEVRKIHDTSPTATIILGRALAAAVMLCAGLKNKTDRMTLTINGGGPAGNIIVAGNAGLQMKAYMQDPGVSPPPGEKPGFNIAGAIGTDGFLTVIQDLGLKEPYVGKTPLVTGEIGEDLAHYYMQSEQQPSVVYLSTWLETDMSIVDAGGVIVKPLPNCSEETIRAIEERVPEIQNFTTYLMAETAEQALKHIFGEMHLSILERRTPAAVCDCSRERLEQVLVSMGSSELEDMIEKDGGAELTCSFCRKKYQFSADDLRSLLDAASKKEGETASEKSGAENIRTDAPDGTKED